MPNTKKTTQETHEELQVSLRAALDAAQDLIEQPDKAFYARHLRFWADHVATAYIDLIGAVMADEAHCGRGEEKENGREDT